MTTQPATKPNESTQRMPVIFAAHGAPILLDDAVWMGELASWAKAMPKPKSILMVSAHWEERPTTLGATRTVPLVYDFSGFPERYYQTKYRLPARPSSPRASASSCARGTSPSPTTRSAGSITARTCRSWPMYPGADVPVLQISMPGLDPQELFDLGQALAPLRDEGVLVFGSGFLTHNMRYAFRPGIPEWAREFDGWAADALSRFDVDALLDFQARAPAAQMALPTWEHYAPVLVAAGAAVVR